MEEKKSDDYIGSKKQSSSGGPLEDEDLVSLASGVAREFLIERRGPSNEGKEESEDGASTRLDSFSMEHNAEAGLEEGEAGGGGEETVVEEQVEAKAGGDSTDTGFSSVPPEVLSEEGVAPPKQHQQEEPQQQQQKPRVRKTTKILIEKAPDEDALGKDEEEEEETSPPPIEMPKRSIGIRIGRNKVGAEDGSGGGGSLDASGRGAPNRSNLRSAQFWSSLAKPRGLRDPSSSQSSSSAYAPFANNLGIQGGGNYQPSSPRRGSDFGTRHTKTARGIRNMRKNVSIKTHQGKKSNQEDLALAVVDGNVSKVEEIVEAFIALYMGEGFRIVMRYRYDLDPRTLEITCVENPLADQQDVESSPEGVSTDMFKGLSILHIACAFDQEQVVSYFLRYGSAILNISTPSGQSLLHTCAWYGATSSAALLLSQGVSLYVENASRHHPLHLASLNGHLSCLRELIRGGAPLDFEDGGGNTPLHAAVLAGHFDCVRELLLYEADVNARNGDGGAPLHYASTPALVSLLMSFGADPTAEIREEAAEGHHHEDGGGMLGSLVGGGGGGRDGKGGHGRGDGRLSCFNLLLERMPEGCEEILSKYLVSNGKSQGAIDLELCYDYDLFLREFERHPRRGEIGGLLKVIWMGRKEILKHPVCESFLHFKWLLVKRIFYAYLFLYCLFLLAITGLILMNFSPNVRNSVPDKERDLATEICFWVSAAFTSVLVFKNLISGVYAFRTYRRSIHNLAELLMLLVTIPFHVLFRVHRDGSEVIHFAAVSAFATWFNFTLLLSNLPAAGVYINMIVHIARDAVKFLSFYFSTLVAFGLCFHVLSHGDGLSGQFSDPVTSVLSTLSMMVGEIAFDVYFARTEVFHQGTTQVMFVIFLLLVPIIMMNLLIGLAISNITTQFQAAGVDRLRMTVLLVRTLNNLFTVLRRICPCCLRDINMFSYLRRKQGLDDDDGSDDGSQGGVKDAVPLKVYTYPNKHGDKVFVKSATTGELVETVFSIPPWVLRNSFKRLELDLNANASQAASEKRRQEERMNGFAAEIKAIRKDLQSVKADVQGVSFFVKSINKPVL